MKFILKAAGYETYEKLGLTKETKTFGVEIEISSLADLEKVQSEAGYELIVDFCSQEITIYDDYIE